MAPWNAGLSGLRCIEKVDRRTGEKIFNKIIEKELCQELIE